MDNYSNEMKLEVVLIKNCAPTICLSIRVALFLKTDNNSRYVQGEPSSPTCIQRRGSDTT